MILGISLLLIIIAIYYLLEWVYKQYKNDLNNIGEEIIEINKQLIQLRKDKKVMEQLINYLYEEGNKK